MAAPAFAFTISRADEILRRGRATLVGLSRRDASGERPSLGSMAPRISRRLPSRPAGMEYLRDLFAEHKRGWATVKLGIDLGGVFSKAPELGRGQGYCSATSTLSPSHAISLRRQIPLPDV